MRKSEALKIRANLESAVQSLPVSAAAEMVEFHPAWKPDTSYPAGLRLRYKGTLYTVIQAHTSQAAWTPDAVPALYTAVNETNAGTADDPIPYDGNMALTAGLYYSQYGTVYRCIRDTVNPVYADLSALAGIYVEVVNNAV